MKKILILIFAVSAILPIRAAEVLVGESKLIGTLFYSDTFDVSGIRPDQSAPTDPNGPVAAAQVENSHGNPPKMWTRALQWSIATSGKVWPTERSPWPGSNGPGSDAGVLQHGGPDEADWGFDGELPEDFVVQFDATVADARTNILLGPGAVSGKRDTPGTVCIFLRTADGEGPEVGVYSFGSNEVDSGVLTGLGPDDRNTWHNFAIRVDRKNDEITVFVDEKPVGSFSCPYPIENAGVGFGCAISTQDRFWADNFQFGLPGAGLTKKK